MNVVDKSEEKEHIKSALCYLAMIILNLATYIRYFYSKEDKAGNFLVIYY
jgi:hypothetical protein